LREFNRIIAPPVGSPYLLVGNKGSGKSAILDFAISLLTYQSVPAILLHPYDVQSSGLSESHSMGDLIRDFTSILLSSISAKLSENSGNFLQGDDATLYHEAVRSQHMSPDLIGRIARALPTLARPLIKLDLNTLLPDLTSVTKTELEKAISNNLSEKRLYVFIDDTDQVANPE
jgi:hypothetical protein